MYHVPLAFQCIYMDVVMKVVKMGMQRRGKNEDYLASCMKMTWFCVVNWRRTWGQWWDELVEVCKRGLKVTIG